MVAANSAPCEECFFCRRGLQNLCEDLLFNNGAYAEYIRIPARIVERNTYQIPEDVSYQDAALVEPLACVLRGLDETGTAPGDTIAIIGLGPIGLMFVRLAKPVRRRVIAIGRRQHATGPRGPWARRAGGAEQTCQYRGSRARPHRRPRRRHRHRSRGQAGDLAVGRRMVRRGGIVNFFGGCPNDSRGQSRHGPAALFRNHLQGQFPSHPAHIRKALDLVRRATFASIFVNREEPLANLLEVMRHLMSHNGHLKTAIIP